MRDGERAGIRFRACLLAGGALLLLLLLSRPMFAGRIYLDTDLREFYLPFRHFYAECLALGQSFLWFPYQYNGFHLHGEGQLGLFHPLNLFSYAALPFSVAFNLELLGAFALMLGGTFWLARRWRLPSDAALLAAVLCTFSGFQFSHFMHLNALNIVAHLPFALLAIDTAFRSPSRARVAGAVSAVSLLSTSQLHLGHPQFTWMCTIVEGTYVAWLLSQRRALRRAAWVVAAKVLAVPLAAVALLPQWESFQGSARAAPDPEFPYSHSLPPERLAELVTPWPLEPPPTPLHGEFAVYDGSITLVLLAWLLLRWNALGTRRPAVLALSGLAAVSLALALGRSGLVYPLLTWLPVVGDFRVPARHLLLVHLAFGFLAAVAFADLARCCHRRRPLRGRRLAILLLPLAAGLVVAAVVAARATVPAPGVVRVFGGPALLAVSTLLVGAAGRGWRPALAAVAVFAIAELGAYGLGIVGRKPPDRVENVRSNLPPPVDGYRVHRGYPELSLDRRRLVGGYVAMEPIQRLRTRDYELEWGRVDASMLQALRISNVGRAYGIEIPAPLPRARLVARAVRERDLERQLGAIDVEQIGIVDADLALPSGVPGDAAIATERPGELVITTRALTRQLLVVSESFHPGWRVRVDDGTGDVLRVYGDFMGVVVPPGHHAVRFVFDPESLRIGKRVSGVALLGLFALAAGAAGSARGGGGSARVANP